MTELIDNLAPLSETNPELLKEWDYERNVGIDPRTIYPGKSKRIWWKCSKNPLHRWQTALRNRARQGKGCPYCAGQRTIPEESFATLRPALMKEWHPSKNKYDPSTLPIGSQKRVWWQCAKGHEWTTLLFVRSKHDKGCPFCRGFLASEKNSLATVYPKVAAEWHPTKNLPLTPATVTKASGKKVWWQCATNPSHEWQAQVKNRTVVNSGCPHCAAELGLRRIREALYETTQANADYFRTFKKAMGLLRRLAVKQVPSQLTLQQPFYRMVYSSSITAMETYLSDAFFQRIINDESLIDRLLMTAPEFKEKKYSISELVDWKTQTRKKVSEYILDMVWHNLPKVEALYKNVLDISFPKDSTPIFKAVAVRHDLVHRNGRSRTGTFHKFSNNEIDRLFSNLEQFVTFIDKQIKDKYDIKDRKYKKGKKGITQASTPTRNKVGLVLARVFSRAGDASRWA